MGAAIQAGMIEASNYVGGGHQAQASDEEVKSPANPLDNAPNTFIQVCPFSYGIRTRRQGHERIDDLFDVFIPKGSQYPCEVSRVKSALDANQDNFLIEVLQGDNEFAEYCHKLSDTTILDVPTVEGQVPTCTIKFKLNADGIMEVEAWSNAPGGVKAAPLEISKESMRLTLGELFQAQV